MGLDACGEICYGIKFPQKFEFPWDKAEFDHDIEDWWRKVRGYKPAQEIYTVDRSARLPGVTQDDVDAHCAAWMAWDKGNPLPIELSNASHYDYPLWLIAVPKVGPTCWHAMPQEFDPAVLVVTAEQRQTLLDFCKEFDIDRNGEEPKWWLCSSFS